MAASVSLRDEILEYAFRQYGVRPEYLWRTSPGDAVLRRPDNRKWFAVLLRVPKNGLGLSGEEETDILHYFDEYDSFPIIKAAFLFYFNCTKSISLFSQTHEK